MNNEPVAWARQDGVIAFHAQKEVDGQGFKWFPLYTHPVKELADEDRSMLIRTLKWSEDLLRIAGHDEAVSDVQDCLMILKKAQEK